MGAKACLRIWFMVMDAERSRLWQKAVGPCHTVHPDKWPFFTPKQKGASKAIRQPQRKQKSEGELTTGKVLQSAVLFSQPCPPMIVLQMIGSERVSNAHVKRLVLTVIAHVRRVYTGAPARIQQGGF